MTDHSHCQALLINSCYCNLTVTKQNNSYCFKSNKRMLSLCMLRTTNDAFLYVFGDVLIHTRLSKDSDPARFSCYRFTLLVLNSKPSCTAAEYYIRMCKRRIEFVEISPRYGPYRLANVQVHIKKSPSFKTLFIITFILFSYISFYKTMTCITQPEAL